MVERRAHPWNVGFEWTDHDATLCTTITAEHVKAYDEVGCFVIEDAFDPATIAELDDALVAHDELGRRFLEGIPEARFGVTGLDSQIVTPHPVRHSEVARAFVVHPLLGGIARDLLGPDVRLYWDQTVYKQPCGAQPVLWHQDNGYTYIEPQSYLTCWVALTDATIDNGCVYVVPEVHRGGTLGHEHTDIGDECWGDWAQAIAMPVRAGSVVVFTSLTPHATPINTTDDVRKAYIVQYAPAGAVALQGDPTAGPPTRRVRQEDAARQFAVVTAGELVSPPAPTSA